jgi:hypothetical protein
MLGGAGDHRAKVRFANYTCQARIAARRRFSRFAAAWRD